MNTVRRTLIVVLLALIAFLLVPSQHLSSVANAQDVVTPSPVPVECGTIVEGEYTSNFELHEYVIEMAPGDTIDVSIQPLGAQLTIAAAIFGPTGLFINRATGGYYSYVAYRDASPEVTSNVLSARGQYSIYAANYRFDTRDFGGSDTGGVGVYTLFVGCTLRDGTVIEPGDIVAQPVDEEPKPDDEAANTTVDDSIGLGSFANATVPEFGFPGLAPVDFADVARLPIPPGVPLTGAISTNGSEILGYLFNANADETVEITFNRLSGNVNLGLVVINENSDIVFQSSLVTTQSLTTRFTVPTGGEYTAGVFRIDLLVPEQIEATAFQLSVTVNPE